MAIDLYSNYYFEMSDSSKFITLVTVLEALTPVSEVSEAAKNSVDEAKDFLKRKRNKYPPNSNQYKEINHVISRLGDLKTQAITTNIRTFIVKEVNKYNLGDSEKLSAKVKEIYKYRSILLHEGFVSEDKIREGLQLLSDFIPRLLKEMYFSSVIK